MIGITRSDKINKLIIEHVPKWKIWLMKRNHKFALFFGIFTIIQPQALLENDITREKLFLCRGSKNKHKILAETLFLIRNTNKTEEVKQQMEYNKTSPVNVGDIITAECISKGEKGDGIFKVQGFVVIVPDTDIGSSYKIKINSVRQKVAFGEIVNE